MKKHSLIFSLIASLSLLLLSGCGAQSQQAAKTIKIGVISVLSGNGAAYGTSIKQGLELARDDINGAGGVDGKQIQLIFEDSHGDNNQAINAAQKLINSDQVLAIIGPTYSGEMFAAGPVANQAKVVIMGTSTTAKGITAIGPYVFRNSLPEAAVIPTTVAKAEQKFGFKKVALMYSSNNAFTASAAKTFQQVLKDQGVKILTTQTFEDGDTNFQAQLTQVAATHPDALVVSALYKEAALLLIQARQMGLNVPVIGGNGFNSPELIKIAGKAAEGAVMGSPWYAGKNDPSVQAFVAKYKKLYNTEPDQFAAQAYDGLGLFAAALKADGASPDRTKFRDALAAIKNYNGVTGQFSFDANRNPVMQATVLQVVNGQFTELK